MVEKIFSTYHLQGKVSMWWDQLKKEKHLDERKVSCRDLEGYFQEKYLLENYYERNMKELFELKLQSMKMDD
jgi:hypothetical protein